MHPGGPARRARTTSHGSLPGARQHREARTGGHGPARPRSRLSPDGTGQDRPTTRRVFLRWRRTNPMIIAHALINSAAFIGYTLLAGHVSWLP